MPSVLFVCTGNQYRSPIAAASFLQQLGERRLADQWVVKSAGTWTLPDEPPLANAVRIAGDLGLNIIDHKTRLVTADELSRYDLILVMERGHKEAITYEFPLTCKNVYLLSEVVDRIAYDIPDPADARVNAKEVALELCDLIQRGFFEICRLAELNHADKL